MRSERCVKPGSFLSPDRGTGPRAGTLKGALSGRTVLSSRHSPGAPRVDNRQEFGMKRAVIAITVLACGTVLGAQRGGPSPEMQAAMAMQEALEKPTPR